MTRSWFLGCTLGLLLHGLGLGSATGVAHAQALQASTEHAAEANADHTQATAFVDALDAGHWARAHGMLATAAAAALSAEKLQEVWQGLDKQLGNRTARAAPRAETLGTARLSTFRLTFPSMSLDARVHVDDAGKIDGFRIVPATTDATPAAAPSAGSGLLEEDRKVAGLSARLALPEAGGRVPAVVLLHGSGPNDMDGTLGPNKPLRDIAHGLAARGIAVLRYTKRTRERPQDFTVASTLDDEIVLDALAAVALLRAEPRVDPDRIIVAGHSLGGQLVPRVALRDSAVAGLVLLAAPARRVHHMVPAQVRYISGLDGTLDEDEAGSVAALERQRDAIDAMLAGGAEPETLMLGASAAYWRDLGSYDAVATAQRIHRPTLVLQGGRDYQVTVEDDFRLWQAYAQGRPHVTTRSFPTLNHLFMHGDGASTPQEYQQPGHVDELVIDAMATWIGGL